MLTAVEGYYNGTQIVMNEGVALRKGQRVIITILDPLNANVEKNINLGKYMGRGKKMFAHGADEYIEELRSNDRL